VLSTHGPDVVRVPERSGIALRATQTALRRADLVMANSRWAERRCREIAGAALRSRVVHFGTDVPAEVAPRHERPTIVTVAHLQARKRHAVVLHALAVLQPDARPDYVVIGDGPGREPLARMAGDLGIADRVRFLGQLPHTRALEEAWRCHVFVMPSVEEPFGVAYIEAMAGGLPAIGTRGQGGPEDIAAAGEGLLLVPPDDHRAVARAIARCLESEPERAALGEAARRTLEGCFTWERCGTATVDAYQAALDAARDARAVTS
jgi:teichuronic acid biosynthesis glycosyltransferase TuaC